VLLDQHSEAHIPLDAVARNATSQDGFSSDRRAVRRFAWPTFDVAEVLNGRRPVIATDHPGFRGGARFQPSLRERSCDGVEFATDERLLP
jgi:hypothetical protein